MTSLRRQIVSLSILCKVYSFDFMGAFHSFKKAMRKCHNTHTGHGHIDGCVTAVKKGIESIECNNNRNTILFYSRLHFYFVHLFWIEAPFHLHKKHNRISIYFDQQLQINTTTIWQTTTMPKSTDGRPATKRHGEWKQTIWLSFFYKLTWTLRHAVDCS